MHVAGRWWDTIGLELDETELGFTREEALACLLISLELHTDQSIARDVLIITTAEVVNAFIFDHTERDCPVDILPHSIDAKINSLTIISRGIECGNARTRAERLKYL